MCIHTFKAYDATAFIDSALLKKHIKSKYDAIAISALLTSLPATTLITLNHNSTIETSLVFKLSKQ